MLFFHFWHFRQFWTIFGPFWVWNPKWPDHREILFASVSLLSNQEYLSKICFAAFLGHFRPILNTKWSDHHEILFTSISLLSNQDAFFHFWGIFRPFWTIFGPLWMWNKQCQFILNYLSHKIREIFIPHIHATWFPCVGLYTISVIFYNIMYCN